MQRDAIRQHRVPQVTSTTSQTPMSVFSSRFSSRLALGREGKRTHAGAKGNPQRPRAAGRRPPRTSPSFAPARDRAFPSTCSAETVEKKENTTQHNTTHHNATQHDGRAPPSHCRRWTLWRWKVHHGLSAVLVANAEREATPLSL